MPARPSPLLTLRALLLFLLIDLGLRFSTFDRVYKTVVRRSQKLPARPHSPDDKPVVESSVGAVKAATKLYYRRRHDCLPKSLALFYLLRRRGISASLCLGVRKYPFGAHAWVEYQGRALDQAAVEVAEFKVLSRA
jgi:transglutaminase superfamily protein